ncbi:unnamed protein product [Mucor hiemalis]
MLYTKSLFVIASALLLTKVESAFNATSNSNIVYYWYGLNIPVRITVKLKKENYNRGQNSAGATGDESLWQKRLSHYCDTEDADIFVVSFLHQFGNTINSNIDGNKENKVIYKTGQGRSTAFDLANSSRDCKGLIPGSQLMDCPQMEEDIEYCQNKDKKIILSLGGATPAYGVDSIKEGERLADELWETFAGGVNKTIARPFGNAKVDGFDLDIENGAKAGYTAFVNKMRKNYDTDTSKTYYVAAAPQCPFPDYFVGDTLNDAWFDFVLVQFYNNYCNVVNTATFNYDVWDSWAKTRSINKDVRLFVGIPGSPSAAGRGYVPYKQLMETIKPLQSKESFGGIMVWDVSQAFGNANDVLPNYAKGLTRLIKGVNDTSSIEYASVASSTSTTSSTSSSAPSATSVSSEASSTISSLPVITTSFESSASTQSNFTSATETATSTMPIATTGCSLLSISTGYSTSNVTQTTKVPISATSGEYTESAVTIQTIIPFSTTITVCGGSNSTLIDSVDSVTSTLLPSNNTSGSDPATALPQEGESCSIEGSYKCSGPASFAQCVYGKYIIRNCAAATVCKEMEGATPPSIYCGFP